MNDEVKNVLKHGLMLDYVTLAFHEAFEKNKLESIKMFGEAVSHFRGSLSEEELKQFDEEFVRYAQDKLKQFITEASAELTEQELLELIEDLKKGFDQ